MKKNETPGVILIGDHVQALSIARSLGQLKVPVILLSDTNLSVVRFSKYVSKFVKMPCIDDEAKFVPFLLNLAKMNDLKDYLLIPTNDRIVKIISMNKSILEQEFKAATPEWKITKFALDKILTSRLAEDIGIPSPKTVFVDSVSDHENLDLVYPVLVKGIEGFDFYKKAGVKAFKVKSEEELKATLNKLLNLSRPPKMMIQELIPGNTDSVYSFCSFFKNGELIGFWTGHKIREHPMGLGTATCAESIYEPEIIELGTKFLKAINYYGISEIEFKKDPRDNKFKLIEINARSWLWISLAKRAGVDFAAMLYNDVNGKKLISNSSFEENIKWVHLYTDSWISFKEILKGTLSIKDYLKSLEGEREYAVFSLDDPLPFIIETLIMPYLLITR